MVPNSETGLVLLEGQIDAAGNVTCLGVSQGPASFVERSLEAVRQWQFNDRGAGAPVVPMTVVLLFRSRTDLPDSRFTLNVPLNPSLNGSPQPLKIVDPGYPFDSAAEGTVILQLEVGTDGRVRKTEVVQPVWTLTEAALEAASHWEFTPASGLVIAVISFPRPTSVY
jgi:outer membrane biosynthesis protein TonB